uniref:Titin n=1 Tax=Amphiprion percula TaxID=161767 RepID=A0A3P8SZG4_AMPPE
MCTPPTGVKKTKFEATNLKENQAYKFRVCAINKVGVGEHADVSGAVVAQDRAEEPDLDIDPELRKIVTIKAGTSLRLFIPIKGRPAPTIKWDKDEAALKETAQVEITSSYTSLVIDKMSRNDSGKYTVTAENSSGTKSAFVVVRVLDTPSAPVNLKVKEITNQSVTLVWEPPLLDGGSKIKNYIIEKRESTRKTYAAVVTNCHALSWKIEPLQEGCKERVEPPEIHLDSELRKGIVVKAGGSVRIHVPFKGRPTPEIKWTKDEGDLNEKAVVEKALNFTQLSLDSCDRSDSGKYALSLTNSSGTASEVVSVKVLDTPGAPQNLVVKDVKRESNYTTFKVENLIEGAMYYFRVMAENEFGIGQAVETKTASKASEVPLSVGKVFLTDVTKATVSLAWEKPQHDGGSRIGGYLIEMLPKGTDKWGVATNTKTCDGTVKGLTAGTEYLFRIIAYNEKGKSEPKALAAPVIASDMTMEPSIKVQFNTYSVLAGKDLKLEFPVLGRPKPKVTWTKDGQALKVTSRVNVLNTPETAVIQITEACKEDFGKYSITATNSAGTVTEDVAVIILDKPGPPTGPVKVVEVSNTFVHLSWEPPEYTGGCQVKNYIVEKRDTTTTTWQPTLIADTQFKICNLEEGIGYEFRVYAENIVGTGRCSKVSDSFVARDPCDPPGAPEAITVSKNLIKIQWTKPQYDGGSKVNGYIVERKDLSSPDGRWVRANFTNIIETEYAVTGLTENEQYEFRVIARNAAGVFSEPSDSSGSITATDELEPPRASMDPKYKDVIVVNAGEHLLLDADIYGKPIPDVAWLKEGKEMDKAVRIEVKTTQKRAAMTIKDVTKLDGGHYDLVLKNLGGTKVLPITVKVLDKPGPPTGPMKVTGVNTITKTTMLVEWDKPGVDGGSTVTGYYLERRDKKSLRWIRVYKDPVTDIKQTVYHLTEGNEYQYRVCAINKAGEGPFSDVSDYYKAADPVGKWTKIHTFPTKTMKINVCLT